MGVGPSTKETTLHHFRDPLVNVLSNDLDIDFVGIIVAGTPQDSASKDFVCARVGAWLEAMRVDGAIISCDGFGNSHVDFANTIEEIGERGIAVVGLTFVGTIGRFVVTNKYMDTIIDFNKSTDGIETQVVGENNIVPTDAKKALAFLKLKMRKGDNI